MIDRCPECKNGYSTKAKSCPHCGRIIPENQFWNVYTTCGVLGVVLFLAIGLIFLAIFLFKIIK